MWVYSRRDSGVVRHIATGGCSLEQQTGTRSAVDRQTDAEKCIMLVSVVLSDADQGRAYFATG